MNVTRSQNNQIQSPRAKPVDVGDSLTVELRLTSCILLIGAAFDVLVNSILGADGTDLGDVLLVMVKSSQGTAKASILGIDDGDRCLVSGGDNHSMLTVLRLDLGPFILRLPLSFKVQLLAFTIRNIA